ncbi:MAG: hypothetical protein QHJ34_14720 [bacterium]|nr:hypothetical protein [candidate division KSB1 bacterium]MDH7561454.1 hypothetical protein [bacterium]
MAHFDRQTNIQLVKQVPVVSDQNRQDQPTTAYDVLQPRWLVVWRAISGGYSVLGRFVDENGASAEPCQVVNDGSNALFFPDAGCLAKSKRFITALEDERASKTDISGLLLDAQGNKIATPRSLARGELGIGNHESGQFHPRLSSNRTRGTICCVWDEERRATVDQWSWSVNWNVYGRLLNEDAALFPPGDFAHTRSSTPFAFSGEAGELTPDASCLGLHTPESHEWPVVFGRCFFLNSTSEMPGVPRRPHSGSPGHLGKAGVRWCCAKGYVHAGTPWLPEFPMSVRDRGGTFIATQAKGAMSSFCGSPLVAANDDTCEMPELHPRRHSNPLPECLVVWTEHHGYSGDLGQRLGSFPDATAFRMGLKPEREADSLHAVALLDEQGDPPRDPAAWKTWEDSPIYTGPCNQEFNQIGCNQLDGTLLVAWNDWRPTPWDESWGADPSWQVPQSDVFGQRLRNLPEDWLLALIDESAGPLASQVVNTPIACSEPSEGMRFYPAIAYAAQQNQFLLASIRRRGRTVRHICLSLPRDLDDSRAQFLCRRSRRASNAVLPWRSTLRKVRIVSVVARACR